MRAFIIALALFLAMAAAIWATSGQAVGGPIKVGPEHYCRAPACQASRLSAAEINRMGAAARMASEGNTAAQAWLDAQLVRVSQ